MTDEHVPATAIEEPLLTEPLMTLGPPVLDEAEFLPMIESLDLDDEQASEFLRTLWDLLVTLMDCNLEIDPVHSLLAEFGENASDDACDGVGSKHSNIITNDDDTMHSRQCVVGKDSA